MSFLINIYIFVCIMLFLFDVFFLLIKQNQHRRMVKRKNRTENMLLEELSLYQPSQGPSDKILDFLQNKTDKTRYLRLFKNSVAKVNRHKLAMQADFFPYVAAQVGAYLKKKDEDQTYYAYAVNCVGAHPEDVGSSFFQSFIRFLDSRSLYVFANAMKAIYTFGDANFLMMALAKVDEREGFYHNKLLVDGLLTFRGDQALLHDMIKGRFHSYRPITQEALIGYFRLSDIREDDFCLDLVKKHKDYKLNDEVYYEVLRYFVKYPNLTMKSISAEIAQRDEGDWIEALLALRILENYEGKWVKSIMKGKVISRNWHIRRSSVAFLQKMGLSKDELASILSLRDRYTNDALLYYYEDDPKMLAFIRKTLEGQRLSLEDGPQGG